ncbi:hypothetical protein JCM10213v2_002634 [Rhodosporidiobolus nylandii]
MDASQGGSGAKKRARKLGLVAARKYQQDTRFLFTTGGLDALRTEYVGLRDEFEDKVTNQKDWAVMALKMNWLRLVMSWLRGETHEPHSLLYWWAVAEKEVESQFDVELYVAKDLKIPAQRHKDIDLTAKVHPDDDTTHWRPPQPEEEDGDDIDFVTPSRHAQTTDNQDAAMSDDENAAMADREENATSTPQPFDLAATPPDRVPSTVGESMLDGMNNLDVGENFECDFDSGGDLEQQEYAGGFDHFDGFEGGSSATMRFPTPQAALEQVERPADLGIGTSAGAARLAAKSKKRFAEDDDSMQQPTAKSSIRGKEKPKNDLPRVEVKQREIEISKLFPTATLTKGKQAQQKNGKAEAQVVPSRSSGKIKRTVPKTPNPDSEEHLLNHFRLDVNALLTNASSPEERLLVALDLFGHLDAVIKGESTPEALWEGEGVLDERDDCPMPNVGWRDVLLTKDDKPKLTFDSRGPYIETRFAKYILIRPSHGYPDELLADFKRLNSIITFCRSRRIRGSYALSDSQIAVFGENVNAELDKLRSRPDQDVEAAEWLSTLPLFWRVEELDKLKLKSGVEFSIVFNALADIPWVTPTIFKLISPHFPPKSFRTDDPEQCEREMEDEKNATRHLLEDYKRRLVQDEHVKLPEVRLGKSSGRRVHPPTQEAEEEQEVEIFSELHFGSDRLKRGTVLLVRPADSPNLRTVKGKARAGGTVSADDEGDSVPEDAREASDSDEREASCSPKAELWFLEMEYAYRTLDKEELYIHGTWFTSGAGIPWLSQYSSPRHLFKLDRCDSLSVDTIVAVVPDCDFRFVERGRPTPERGFFCWAAYNEQDGAFVERPRLDSTSASTCLKSNIEPCLSCESTLLYLRRTAATEDATKRVLKAIASEEGLFELAGTTYHENDLITVRPHTDHRARHGPQRPLRLARLLAICPAPYQDEVDEDDPLAFCKVEWIVRFEELFDQPPKGRFVAEREVVLTGKTARIDSGRLDGKFELRHVAEEELRLPPEELVALFYDLEVRSAPSSFWFSARFHPQAITTYKNKDDMFDGAFVVSGIGALKHADKLPPSATCNTCGALSLQQKKQRGGLKDTGYQEGCPPLHTDRAIECHDPAASFNRSNSREYVDVDTVSNHLEAVYHRRDTGAIARHPHSTTGGAPCQGFSHANRFKRVDDLRCLEPFVGTLGGLAVHRPLFSLFENVADFLKHSLPGRDSESTGKRGSFAQLFFAVALELQYQLRFNVDNAAAYGTPQDRRRILVSFAARGVPLPASPSITHVVHEPRAQFDHSLREGTREKFLPALHPAVNLRAAVGDLPSFGYDECFDDDMEHYVQKPIGPEWNADHPVPYSTAPLTSYQLRARSQGFMRVTGEPQHASVVGVTHHMCKAVNETTARRLCQLGIKGEEDEAGIEQHGNYHDLEDWPFHPDLPAWLLRLSTLRTRLSLDGASHGPRIHPEQSRPLSVREFMRIQGLPDWVEVNFSADTPDDTLEETYRILGNGVPLPLAAAYGRALYDAILPYLVEHIESGRKVNCFDRLADNIGVGKLRERASQKAAKRFAQEQRKLRRAAESDDSSRSTTPESSGAMEEDSDDDLVIVSARHRASSFASSIVRDASPDLEVLSPPVKRKPQRLAATRSTSSSSSSGGGGSSATPFGASRRMRDSTRPTSLETSATPMRPLASKNGKGKAIDLTLSSDDD